MEFALSIATLGIVLTLFGFIYRELIGIHKQIAANQVEIERRFNTFDVRLVKIESRLDVIESRLGIEHQPD